MCTKVSFQDKETTQMCLKEGTIHIGTAALKLTPHRPLKEVSYDISVVPTCYTKVFATDSTSGGQSSEERVFQTDWFGFKATPRKGISRLLADQKMLKQLKKQE